MQGISNPDQQTRRQEILVRLYKSAFPVVARYVSRMGGSFDEAKDVFQDALVVYYEKMVVSPAVFNNDTAYLVGTAKNLWLKRYRQTNQNVPLDNIDLHDDEIESPSNNRLLRFLETAGKKCMELLKGFYYDQLSLTEIADEFGYSGTRSATVQKYKCLEKVRETVKEKALAYDDFME